MAITPAIHKKETHISNNKCGNTISHKAITSAKCGIISSTHTLIITSVKEIQTLNGITSAKINKIISICPNKIIRVCQH